MIGGKHFYKLSVYFLQMIMAPVLHDIFELDNVPIIFPFSDLKHTHYCLPLALCVYGTYPVGNGEHMSNHKVLTFHPVTDML
jgi:hypothetical protein